MDPTLAKELVNAKQRSTERCYLDFNDDSFNDPLFNEFQIKCGDSTFYMSKIILARGSPVFKSMLNTEMKEARDGCLTIVDSDPEAVEAMLRFLFNGKKIDNYETARKVIELAEKYQITDLKEECEIILIEKMTLNHVHDIVNLSYNLKQRLLLKKCFEVGFSQFNDFGAPAALSPADPFDGLTQSNLSEQVIQAGSDKLSTSSRNRQNFWKVVVLQQPDECVLSVEPPFVVTPPMGSTDDYTITVKKGATRPTTAPVKLLFKSYRLSNDRGSPCLSICGIVNAPVSLL